MWRVGPGARLARSLSGGTARWAANPASRPGSSPERTGVAQRPSGPLAPFPKGLLLGGLRGLAARQLGGRRADGGYAGRLTATFAAVRAADGRGICWAE